MNYPQPRLPDQEISIFAVMSQLAQETGAINLSQGFPDFSCPERLMEWVYEAMRAGKNQYAPMPGVPELRRAIARKLQQFYGVSYDPDTEITITAGATEAIYAAVTSTVRPGDEVIIFEPFYDAYPPVVRYARGVPVYIPLQLPDFTIPWDLLVKKLTRKTRLVIINTPHNPSGQMVSREDWEQLATLLEGTSCLLLSDEVYEHIVFDGARHTSAAQIERLKDRAFVISSFGKTFHATGWKVGFCAAPAPLSELLRGLHQFVVYAVNTPVQHAYARALENMQPIRELAAFYQQKRDMFRDGLRRTRFQPLPCRSTYFLLADYRPISDEADREFVVRMTREYGVAAIPLSPFYHDRRQTGLIRFCFAKREETLKRATDLLCKI